MNELSTLETPAILAALLVGVGKLLKTWEWFPNKYIPTVLAVLGVVANCVWSENWKLVTVFIGFAAGTTAVWGNQWWRQTLTSAGDPTDTPTPVTPATKTPNAGPLLALICVGAMAALSCTGCVTALKSDKITSMSASGIGLKATSPDGTGVLAGIFRVNVHFIPTSTNSIYSPRYINAFDTKQGWNPFMQCITESVASGEMMVSTNATGGAVIPKTFIPAVPVR